MKSKSGSFLVPEEFRRRNAGENPPWHRTLAGEIPIKRKERQTPILCSVDGVVATPPNLTPLQLADGVLSGTIPAKFAVA